MRAFIAGLVVDRISNLVHDSVPDVIVATYKLALAAGAVEEVHRVLENVDPSIASAHDATLRIADVQGRRGS
jgi:hypothetical protein